MKIDSLISTLDQLIANKESFFYSSEMNFASLRSVDNLNQANTQLYAKTGKLISMQRESPSPKIIVYLDINANLKERMKVDHGKPGGVSDVLNAIRDHFSGEVLFEVRDANNEDVSDYREEEVVLYDKDCYESDIEYIIERSQLESQQGNTVIIVSDFLSLEFPDTLPHDIIYVQLVLPVMSSQYHRFYVKSPERPDVDYRFEL